MSSGSFLERSISPYLQGGIALGAATLLIFLGKVAATAGLDMSPKFAWMSVGAFMLTYAVFNSILSLVAKDAAKYWGQSIMSYLGLVFIGGGLAHLVSGLSLNEAGSFRWIFTVLSIGYLVFLSIVNLMKKIVEFAMREDWQNPRIRNKKKR